jgi:ketosteroid isomerase-like protein
MRALCIVVVLGLGARVHAAPPQKADVVALVAAWQDAQNKGDLAAYVALYDAKFVGVKRTSDGGQKTYTLAEWRADRSKMFKGPQKVAAEKLKVEVGGDVATVWFEQRWQGKSYADHGSKRMQISSASGAPKIVREELLYSAPGWADDPNAELDASKLVSPITARVRTTDKVKDTGCGNARFMLELTDAKGKTLKQELGTGFVDEDTRIDVMEPESGNPMFKFGTWCAGGGDYYEVRSSGDSLVVRHQPSDEDGPEVPWETMLTVKLPAGAKLK